MSRSSLCPSATLAIIGGGFSGAAVAARALARPATSIHIIEDRADLALGLTYGDVESHHILNVPAGHMSFWTDRPGDFLEWSRAHGRRLGWPQAANATADSYLQRGLFGHYARQVLNDACAKRAAGSSLIHHRTRAVALQRSGSGFTVALANGDSVAADAVVYVPGNNLPSSLWPVVGQGTAYVENPWSREALADLPTDAPVLIVGTGLTMVDTVYSLDRHEHRGTILAVSRHGMLPGARGKVTAAAAAIDGDAARHGCGHLLHRIRAAIATHDDWRAVIDGLRPVTEDVWATLSDKEKRRFLRHLRPFWEVARHRMPAESEALLARLQAQGRLTIQAARIAQVVVDGDRAEVTLAPRGSATPVRQSFARVINCTPGACDYSRFAEPLVRDLIGKGLLRADSLHLGIDVRADGALISQGGHAVEGLFTLGPPLRGVRFEVTAVPDIRVQADALHDTVSAHLQRVAA